MAEKCTLDLPLLLPGIPDERDACVGRLTALLQAEGLERVHVVREDGGTRLCLHYDPQGFSVSRVHELARAAGAKIANRFHHESLRIDGMDCATCATVIEHALQRTDGVLEASVSYAAERLRLEYDSEKTARQAIVRRIEALGYGVLEEGPEAGWFAEHRELIFSGVSGLLLLIGWLAGLAGAPHAFSLGLLLGAYAAGGFYTLRDAWQSVKSRRFDIDTLMIVAAAGAAAAFLANAVSYIGLVAVLARWRPELPPKLLPRERLGVAMWAGVSYVSMSPKIQLVLLRGGAFGIGASAVSALMPLVARDVLGGGALTFGLTSGAFGVGAVAGALSTRRLRARFSIEAIVRSAALSLAAGTAITAMSGYLALALLGYLLAGAGWVMALSTFNVSVQMSAPRWVVARAVAIYQMTAFGGMAIGAWLFGNLAEDHGVVEALYASAAVQLVAALIGFVRPLPQIGDDNLDLQNRWREPETAVPVEPRSGPVVITIEYRIPVGSVVPFLSAMSERRRIRKRDGAHGWSLMRDLGDPELWVERYHVSTWLDYVRHNQRRTIADITNSDTIHALHSGGKPPVVHRMLERQTGSLPLSRAPDPREMGDGLTDPTRST